VAPGEVSVSLALFASTVKSA